MVGLYILHFYFYQFNEKIYHVQIQSPKQTSNAELQI